MKLKIYTLILCLGLVRLSAQTYPHQNINLVGFVNPETVTVGTQKYSGCWGWYQAGKNKEYALVGSVAGTYFIDISAPATPIVCDYVPGKTPSTWRELKTYQNYCYVVSDVQLPNTYQIIDMQYLPDSVHVVYEGTSLFERGHATWIDNNRWYVSGLRYLGGVAKSMEVYSLATPTAPTLIRSLNQDYPSISYVHDMFCINDTVFASAGNQGLHTYKLTGANTFSALGSLTTYAESGYNHSTYITANRKYMVMCDEVPSNLSIKCIDVQNLANITPLSLFRPNLNTQFVGHNPYVVGNKWAFVSCYQDGLQLYDISNPNAPVQAGYFDTYPQGGSSAGNNYGGSSYMGNWGAYPYFPSGLILACDMQNGVFILEANALMGIGLGIGESTSGDLNVNVFPNPTNGSLQIDIKNDEISAYTIEISNLLGEVIMKQEESSSATETFINKKLDVSSLSTGTYFVSVRANNKLFRKKIIIAK